MNLYLLEVAPSPHQRVFGVFTSEERALQAADVATAMGSTFIEIIPLELDDFWEFQKALRRKTVSTVKDVTSTESKFLGEIE